MKKNNENMEELIKQFFDEEISSQVHADIQRGDELLSGCKSPEPDESLIADIKLKLQAAVEHRRSKRVVRAFYRTAAAAMILFGIMVGVQFFNNNDITINGTGVTASAGIWGDDESQISRFDVLTAEIDELEGNLINIRLGELEEQEAQDVTDLEMEVIELAGGFWKG